MIKNFTKLLMVNWILCLIVSFISSANAADDTVVHRERRLLPLCESKEDNAVNPIHQEHRPRLSPLAKLNNVDCVAWHNGLTALGYIKSCETVVKISEEFSANYGLIRGHDTEEQAALACWKMCDKALEGSIIVSLRSYVEKEGFLITPEMIEMIRDRLNPDRGTVRCEETTNRFHILTLDKTRLFKFHLNTVFSHNILNKWTCCRYTARMTANLDIGIYEFLGK
jgi:hypothetical protein